MQEQSNKEAWEALASPKMSHSAFNQMMALDRFKDVPEEERPAEILRVWNRWASRFTVESWKESSRSKFIPSQNKWQRMNIKALIIWAVVSIPLTVLAILFFGL